MERECDIAIVGAGVTGLFIAYYASKLDLGRIVIVEGNRVGSGASSRNLAGIREQYSVEPLIRLMKRGIDIWEMLPEELKWNLLFDQKGYLLTARSEEQMEQLKTNVALQRSLGVRSCILSPGEVNRIIPFFVPGDLCGASFNRRDGSAHHDAVIWAVEHAARKNGVEILENTNCLGISTSGGSAIGIATSNGQIRASKVVVAAGVRSRELVRAVGPDLPIKSFTREALVTEPYKHVIDTHFWDLTLGLAFSQTLRGEVLCETRDPPAGESYSIEASIAFVGKMAREIVEVCPSLSHLRVLRQWAGEYDVTPDGSPILGEINEVENLYVAAGFSGHGLMMSPVVGSLFAQLLSTGVCPELMRPFVFQRFEEGRLMREALVAGRKMA